MTSLDFLFQNLLECPKDKLIWYSYFDKAKEMHKKEIIDAYYQCGIDNFEHINDLSNSEIPNLSDEKTLSEKYQEYKDWLNEIHELSDDEINKQAEPIEEGIYRMFFKTGAKWYREQLKQRQ
jgi:uncharacterized protein (UPF0305 family)